jgi:hypothetical protein
MKTKKQALSETAYPKLLNAVISRVGMESVEDINNHGIDGGFNGFIYYKDTVKFFNTHKKDILAMAKDMSESLGEDMLTMIQGFNCLGKKDYTVNEIGGAIYGGRGEQVDIIKNAMAWFAAEEVCRMFED